MTTREQIHVGDAVLSVELHDQGDGSWVFLLPGAGGGLGRFAALVELLTGAGFRVVGVEPRGVDDPKARLDDIDLHDMAGDVAELIKMLGAAPAALVGVAFGNRLARCVAADHPDLVSRIALISAGGKVPAEREAGRAMTIAFDWMRPEAERLEAVRTAFLAPNSEVEPRLGAAGDPDRAGLASAQIRAAGRTDVDDWWGGGLAPVLVIQGLWDRIAPPANGHQLRAAHPDRVTVLDVPDAAHAVLSEKPDVVNKAILRFLRGA